MTKDDFQSGSVSYYTSGGNSGFQPGDENQAPAQVTIEALPDGNMAALSAVDIWKDLGDGSWNSDYDLFYRIFNPEDGSFVTDENPVKYDTNDKISVSTLMEVFILAFNIVLSQEDADPPDTYIYNSVDASISEPPAWTISSDNNLEWVDIGRGIQVTIDE